MLPNSRAIVSHQGGQYRWARGMKGWLNLAQKPQTERISCNGRATTLSRGAARSQPSKLPKEFQIFGFEKLFRAGGFLRFGVRVSFTYG